MTRAVPSHSTPQRHPQHRDFEPCLRAFLRPRLSMSRCSRRARPWPVGRGVRRLVALGPVALSCSVRRRFVAPSHVMSKKEGDSTIVAMKLPSGLLAATAASLSYHVATVPLAARKQLALTKKKESKPRSLMSYVSRRGRRTDGERYVWSMELIDFSTS